MASFNSSVNDSIRNYKIIVYVPATHVEQVKTALFDAGAGKQGCYDQCCWQALGEGQFRPLIGSQPFIGEESKQKEGFVGAVETVAEYRVEMLCEHSFLKAAIAALRKSHPYEEPAFDIFQLYAF